MDALQRPDETLDDLKRDGLRILQKRGGFRFGVDAVLLADFARAGAQAHVVDFGTGSGVIPMLMAARGKGRRFDALEADADIADMAARSVRLNGMEERIRVRCRRAEEAAELLGRNTIDTVVCNPPYWGFGRATEENAARVQAEGGLKEWFAAAYRVLRGKGSFCLVYSAPWSMEALRLLHDAGLEPKRLRCVHHDARRPATLVLIEALKSGHPGTEILPPLVLCEPDGTPTAEQKRIYGEDAADDKNS